MTAVIAAGLGLLLGLGFAFGSASPGRHRPGVPPDLGTDLMLRRGQLQRWLKRPPLGGCCWMTTPGSFDQCPRPSGC